MTYRILDTTTGRKYTYHDELQARAVLRIAGMKLCQPRGWPMEQDDARDCVALPEPRKPSWLLYLFGVIAFVAALVMVDVLWRGFAAWWIGGGR